MKATPLMDLAQILGPAGRSLQPYTIHCYRCKYRLPIYVYMCRAHPWSAQLHEPCPRNKAQTWPIIVGCSRAADYPATLNVSSGTKHRPQVRNANSPLFTPVLGIYIAVCPRRHCTRTRLVAIAHRRPPRPRLTHATTTSHATTCRGGPIPRPIALSRTARRSRTWSSSRATRHVRTARGTSVRCCPALAYHPRRPVSVCV